MEACGAAEAHAQQLEARNIVMAKDLAVAKQSGTVFKQELLQAKSAVQAVVDAYKAFLGYLGNSKIRALIGWC